MELPTAQNSATMGNYNKSFSNAMQLEVGSMYEFSIWINTGDSTLSGGEGAYAMVRTYKADDGSGAGTGNAYYSTNHVKDTQGELMISLAIHKFASFRCAKVCKA